MTTRTLQDIRDEIAKLESRLSDLELEEDYDEIEHIVRNELNPLIDELIEREETEA